MNDKNWKGHVTEIKDKGFIVKAFAPTGNYILCEFNYKGLAEGQKELLAVGAALDLIPIEEDGQHVGFELEFKIHGTA